MTHTLGPAPHTQCSESSVLGGESFQKCFGMEDEPFLQLPAGQTILTQPATDGKVNNDVSYVYFLC